MRALGTVAGAAALAVPLLPPWPPSRWVARVGLAYGPHGSRAVVVVARASRGVWSTTPGSVDSRRGGSTGSAGASLPPARNRHDR